MPKAESLSSFEMKHHNRDGARDRECVKNSLQPVPTDQG